MPMEPLASKEQQRLAVKARLIGEDQPLREIQIESGNFVLSWKGDLCICAPTSLYERGDLACGHAFHKSWFRGRGKVCLLVMNDTPHY